MASIQFALEGGLTEEPNWPITNQDANMRHKSDQGNRQIYDSDSFKCNTTTIPQFLRIRFLALHEFVSLYVCVKDTSLYEVLQLILFVLPLMYPPQACTQSRQVDNFWYLPSSSDKTLPKFVLIVYGPKTEPPSYGQYFTALLPWQQDWELYPPPTKWQTNRSW